VRRVKGHRGMAGKHERSSETVPCQSSWCFRYKEIAPNFASGKSKVMSRYRAISLAKVIDTSISTRHSIVTERSTQQTIFSGAHYSPLGNQLVVRYILEYLYEQKLVHNNGATKTAGREASLSNEYHYSEPDVCTAACAKGGF
jgi:hypothetical protein